MAKMVSWWLVTQLRNVKSLVHVTVYGSCLRCVRKDQLQSHGLHVLCSICTLWSAAELWNCRPAGDRLLVAPGLQIVDDATGPRSNTILRVGRLRLKQASPLAYFAARRTSLSPVLGTGVWDTSVYLSGATLITLSLQLDTALDIFSIVF